MEFRRVLFRSIGYTLKDAWRRSAHSTQTIRVMPDTRGRGTGEAVSPSWTVRKSRDDESHLWRAVCAERCTHGSERSEEHTPELQSHLNLVCRLLLEKKKRTNDTTTL